MKVPTVVYGVACNVTRQWRRTMRQVLTPHGWTYPNRRTAGCSRVRIDSVTSKLDRDVKGGCRFHVVYTVSGSLAREYLATCLPTVSVIDVEPDGTIRAEWTY